MEEVEDYVHPFPPSLTPEEEEEEANAYTAASPPPPPSDVRPIGVAPVFLFLPPSPFFSSVGSEQRRGSHPALLCVIVTRLLTQSLRQLIDLNSVWEIYPI